MEIGEILAGEYEQIQVLRDPAGAVLAFVVVHNTRLGPAFGGIRRFVYANLGEALADAMRLAQRMTLKCAVSGIPGGGGKTVIAASPETDRELAYRLIGRYVEQMRGRYYTGPDVGTTAADLALVAEHTAFVARPGPGGPGDLAEPTAVGVLSGIRAVGERLGASDLSGLHVVVQGLGGVGLRLARLLREAGARLTVSDARHDHAEQAARELEVAVVEPTELLEVDADVLAPCALGGVVDERSVGRLRVRAIAGAANNVLAGPEQGRALFERGILYAPDFVINAGALIVGASFHLEGKVPPRDRVERIGAEVGEILDRARDEGLPPEEIALRIARERVAAGRREPFFPIAGPRE